MQPKWLDKKEYPFASNYFEINGHKLHYIDEGSGEILLFIHGTPSWSFDFRNVIRSLRTGFRCIAIDHIGFGLSDKPGNYDYSTQNHSSTLEQFILMKKLSGINLVVHDFGGPVGLNVAIKHPNLFKRFIILNSWLWSAEQDAGYKRMKKILKSPLLPFLYRRLNFSPSFIMPASFGKIKLKKKIKKHFTRPFSKSSERNGALAFARSLLNDQPWFEKLWEAKSSISEKPVQFIWGLKDPVISPAYLEKFKHGFPNHRVFVLPGAGHFPQEEQSLPVAEKIRSFLS